MSIYFLLKFILSAVNISISESRNILMLRKALITVFYSEKDAL